MLSIAENLIDLALGQPRIIQTNLPRSGRATLREQRDQDRYVLHLFSANPALRGHLHGNPVQPIQDLIPLYDVDVSIGLTHNSEVSLIPDGAKLPATFADGRLDFTVPVLRGAQMIQIARIRE